MLRDPKPSDCLRLLSEIPFFGFSRTFYYEGEHRGYWRLIRIRERGKLRGVTLVPFDAVARFVHGGAAHELA